MTAAPVPVGALRRVTVRLPNWLGDTVMAVPTVLALRAAAPSAELWCLGPWAETVLDGEPAVTRALATPRGARARLAQARSLARAEIDLLVVLPNSFETALAAWMTGARWRIGYRSDGRGRLLTHALRPVPGHVHQVDAYLRLLAPLGVTGPAALPRLTVDPARRAEAQALLASVRLGPEARPIGLQLGAALGPAKLWPAARLAALAARLEARGLGPVFLGGPSASPLLHAVTAAAGGRPVRSLVGRDRPAVLAALLGEMDALVCADSGPAHVAAAVGVPVVTLFGPTDPRLTAPRGPRQRDGLALWRPPVCAPCFLASCPIDHRCLAAVTIDDVEAAVMAALDRAS